MLRVESLQNYVILLVGTRNTDKENNTHTRERKREGATFYAFEPIFVVPSKNALLNDLKT